jgi:hypothetical protein
VVPAVRFRFEFAFGARFRVFFAARARFYREFRIFVASIGRNRFHMFCARSQEQDERSSVG